MNLLLNSFINIGLPIIIILLAIIIAVVIFKSLQKKFNKPLDTTIRQNEIPQIKLKTPYCSEEQMRFLEALHRALPRDCISFPNVGVSKLIEPKGNLNDYKSILDQYVDVCVFLRKNMKPILVIDLYKPTPTAQLMKTFSDNIVNVLKVAKIPLLHKQIQNNYNIDELTVEILNHMDATTVTYLKSKQLNTSVNK